MINQEKNAQEYGKKYSKIIARELELKQLAAQIKEELDLIKTQKLDYYEVFGQTMSNDKYHDLLVEVEDGIALDPEKVKAEFKDWQVRFGKAKVGYRYIQTKLTNQTVGKI